jgi:hypothetical protein
MSLDLALDALFSKELTVPRLSLPFYFQRVTENLESAKIVFDNRTQVS